MHKHFLEGLLLLAVAIHAALHWREDVVSAWHWIKRTLGITNFWSACRSSKAITIFVMVAMGCIAASPFIYYGIECIGMLAEKVA
jgi:hypothetical protein